jgi:hypothetical protein
MNTSTLTIDQLLRAAQIIEQNVVTDPNKIFCNFGSDYEERDTITKMRAALCLNSNIVGAPSSSTGSSIRSSPTSMMSSSPNSPNDMKHRASSSQSTRQSRAAHNELEKNRRSQLRSFLEKLKSVLPADHDSTRDTTLSLLTRARNYLRAILEQKQQLVDRRTQLLAEQLQLVELLEKTRQEHAQNLTQPKMVQQQQQQQQEEERFSPPSYMEYSPSAKPISSPGAPTTITIDLYMEGLMPAIPLLYPYTYLDELHTHTRHVIQTGNAY